MKCVVVPTAGACLGVGAICACPTRSLRDMLRRALSLDFFFFLPVAFFSCGSIVGSSSRSMVIIISVSRSVLAGFLFFKT